MTLDQYQDSALQYTFFPHDMVPSYLSLALCGEAGEVADKVKKVIRDKDGKADETDCREIALELGDTLWYLAVLAKAIGYSLEQIAQANLGKIKGRYVRGTLHGSGDHR